MIRKNARSLSDVLQEVLDLQNLSTRLNETKLIEAWPDIVGKNVADQTKQLYIKNNTLFIHVKSAIVRNELMLMRDALTKKLNDHVGKTVIKNIILR